MFAEVYSLCPRIGHRLSGDTRHAGGALVAGLSLDTIEPGCHSETMLHIWFHSAVYHGRRACFVENLRVRAVVNALMRPNRESKISCAGLTSWSTCSPACPWTSAV